MTSTLFQFARSQSGATAVEFALVVVPFLLIVYGTIEFGRAIWTREALQSIATETARCMGVLEPDCAPSGTYNAASTKTHVKTQAGKLSVLLPDSAVTLNENTSCAGVNGFSQVAISYDFRPVLPLLPPSVQEGIRFDVSACFPNQAGAS